MANVYRSITIKTNNKDTFFVVWNCIINIFYSLDCFEAEQVYRLMGELRPNWAAEMRGYLISRINGVCENRGWNHAPEFGDVYEGEDEGYRHMSVLTNASHRRVTVNMPDVEKLGQLTVSVDFGAYGSETAAGRLIESLEYRKVSYTAKYVHEEVEGYDEFDAIDVR